MNIKYKPLGDKIVVKVSTKTSSGLVKNAVGDTLKGEQFAEVVAVSPDSKLYNKVNRGDRVVISGTGIKLQADMSDNTEEAYYLMDAYSIGAIIETING